MKKWQQVAENSIPKWEYVSCILEEMTAQIQNILQTRKNSKRPRRTLSEKEQTSTDHIHLKNYYNFQHMLNYHYRY